VYYWRAHNKTIICDIDDSYKDMTEETGSPTYKLWIKGISQKDGKDIQIAPAPLTILRHSIKLCNGLSSPSKLICEDWKDYTKTWWFPNYVDLDLYQPREVYREKGVIRIGWGGSMTHLVSWTKSGAAEAFTQIVKEYPGVVITGFGDPRTERFFKVPPHNRAIIGWVPQPIFPSKLSHFDIGLIPLYGEYDRRRSWIKTAEYSTLGIPWIGSDMEPTQEINTGVRVKNTATDWYNAMKFYIDNLGAMKEAAVKNIPMAREKFGIENHTNDLVKLFEDIINEK
jgi:glycosyltransferase involved in cell wall biosynthesis